MGQHDIKLASQCVLISGNVSKTIVIAEHGHQLALLDRRKKRLVPLGFAKRNVDLLVNQQGGRCLMGDILPAPVGTFEENDVVVLVLEVHVSAFRGGDQHLKVII